jgi:hypothetical protein
MWNLGTMHPQGPKNPDTQRKPGAPFLASFAGSGAFSLTAENTPATPWIPNSALPPVHQDSINSIVRKTLLATPEFPRLYADMVLSTRPNSAEAKILRPKYQQILHRINLMENRKSCTHIKISGIRCGSPSLRGEQFCYYHQRMHRGVRTPPQSRLHPLACIEDKESIQGRARRSHQCAAAQHHRDEARNAHHSRPPHCGEERRPRQRQSQSVRPRDGQRRSRVRRNRPQPHRRWTH